MQPGRLRGNVTSTAVVQAGQVARNFTPLVQIEVRGPTKVKAEKASNSFANTVVRQVVPYIDRKMELLVSTNSNATVNAAEQRRGEVVRDLDTARQLLSLAENVELSRVVQPAVGVRTSATSRRNAAAVGALAGLLLGALAAIVADPWLRRRSAAAG